MGIQPEVLVLRTEHELNDDIRAKVAHFCNVDMPAVIQSQDLPSIYEVPVNMQRQGLDTICLKKMGIEPGVMPELGPWHNFLEHRKNATSILNIGLVGKYDLQDAYKSIIESLAHAGTYNDRKIKTHFINSEYITKDNIEELLNGMSGVVICPGFGTRGIEGKIIAAEYTRTHNIPTFGICLGMQMMVIEFARNVLGFSNANSSEMDINTPYNVIDMMEEQTDINQKGGIMRLGSHDCNIVEGSRTWKAYGKVQHIKERHRHRYEFNNKFVEAYEQNGMKCVGVNPDSNLIEIVEIPSLKWYIGTQFHPEYSSTVLHPHPLFMSFIKACIGQ